MICLTSPPGESSIASLGRIGESRCVHFLRLAVIFLGLPFAVPATASSDCQIVLDIFPERIEAVLLLPSEALEDRLGHSMTDEAIRNGARDAVALYLQAHLAVLTKERRPIPYDLDGLRHAPGGLVEASLSLYPPDDLTPQSFVISGDLLQEPGTNRSTAVFLRRDAAEMRFGLEPLIPLGKLDYFHKTLTIEREPLDGYWLGTAALAAASRLLLSSGATLVLLAMLLMQAALASQGRLRTAFIRSARAAAVFASGLGAALLTGAVAAAGWAAAGMAFTLLLSALMIWRPLGARTELCVAAVAGWLTGVSWNGAAIASGTSGAGTATHLYLAAAGFVILAAVTLLVLPTCQVLAGRLPPALLRIGGAVCGIIVALRVLTNFALPQ